MLFENLPCDSRVSNSRMDKTKRANIPARAL
ncbi:MAG: hypothetical protein [Podoviridae sp. ctKoA10]|nr:MAG: hypothetical protein [Podoviridae sp. ctKoA10]